MESKAKISKKRLQEMVEEEVYRVLRELGISELTPEQLTEALKAAEEAEQQEE